MPIDFEALLGRSPNPYVVLDGGFVIVWMNEAYLRVTMRERDDIVGRHMFDAFPSDPQSESFRQLDESLRRVRDTGAADEIALIRYDIQRPDGAMDVRYWSATHTPFSADGEVQYILQHTVDVTELHKLRQMRDEMHVVQRANAVEARNRDLLAESRRLKELFEQAPGFVAVIEGEDYRFRMTNEAYNELLGRRELLGRTVREAVPEVESQGFMDVLDHVRATGEPYFGRRELVLLAGPDGGDPVQHHLNFIFQPILDEGNEVSGIMVQGYDVTEEVEYEERQRLLINELNHRVKNTLAVVQGLAAQSFRTVDGAEAAQAMFNSRLQALAAAHNLLTQSSWGAASLHDVVHSAAEAATGAKMEHFVLRGPAITLEPQTSVSLAMVIHELCTNALKYGALSNEEGRIVIEWDVRKEGAGSILALKWTESGGPPVNKPDRNGFGLRLINRGLSSEKGSSVDIEFEPSGLICRIEAPISQEAA